MIEIINKSKCCGCYACVNACPENCIHMKRDEEGFNYPSVNSDSCTKCNVCQKVCPEINLKEELNFEQDGYLIQIKDEQVRKESTAGGAFTAIAKYVIKNDGVVFGVMMDENFNVYHSYVETEQELNKFRNSKYVQSNVGESTLKQVKQFLVQSRLVCFSGTPCQIEGLKSFLVKEYNNLITVDVVCRAVPSPLVFEKYLELQNRKLDSNVVNIRFRDKHFGYKYSTMNIYTLLNNGNYHHGIESDLWLRTFFSGICNRPSCYECSFRKRYRVSDFTIWDCFNVHKYSKQMNDDKGTTRMLVHTYKGRSIFEQIKQYVKYVKLKPDEMVLGVKEMFESMKPNIRRSEFMIDLNILDVETLFDKYFPYTFRIMAERRIRLIMCKIGIYGYIKKLFLNRKD